MAASANSEHQEHPLGIYFKIWFLLFVLSTLSYMVDILDLQGYLRWSLIVIFMMLKAGLIVAVFMHMVWERLAIVYAILVPPLALIVLMALMALEGDYTEVTRQLYFVFGGGG
ncbi:MAG: cytochrome C oxidase subunit IV [Alphaproteobacteria bacterium]|nr:cytochrome C oxidase subunit IV [Alphaproteobacteria bacterium]